MTSSISRREFLKRGGTAASVAGAGMPLVMNLAASGAAHAGISSGYKALVCVFLAGGNDAHNTVIRTDKGLQRFKAARDSVAKEVLQDDASLAPRLPLTVTASQNKTGIAGLSLALHPRLANIKSLFEQNRVAIIGNIGPLAAPTTASAFLGDTVALPPKLFSHNDQTSMWQSGQPEGAISGWGGEFVRLRGEDNHINGASSQLFSAVAIESTPVFCAGTSTRMPVQKPVVSPFGASRSGGALRPGGLERDAAGGPAAPYLIRWRIERDAALPPIFSGQAGIGEGATAGSPAGNLIEKDYLKKLNSANQAWLASDKAMAGVSVAEPNAENPLAVQLSVVARMIKSSGNDPLALTRQVFFVQLGGFDTHSGQTGNGNAHARLLAQVDEALKYFDDVLGADRANVVTFTASEFGRKLNENGDGTDHGWGGHHFVMGGSVAGGVYGHFPDLSTWSDTTRTYGDGQLLPDGTLVPSVSVDVFAKELGKWLGIDWAANGEVATQLFPNLPPSTPLLGFLA